jgi:hypothetical protein
LSKNLIIADSFERRVDTVFALNNSTESFILRITIPRSKEKLTKRFEKGRTFDEEETLCLACLLYAILFPTIYHQSSEFNAAQHILTREYQLPFAQLSFYS